MALERQEIEILYAHSIDTPERRRFKFEKIMPYIVTLKKLEELDACQKGLEYFMSSRNHELKPLCYDLVEDDHANWANWLLISLMNKKQRVQFAAFAAKRVLHIFEARYPEDSRPRRVIEAAEKWVKNSTDNAARTIAAATADAFPSARKEMQLKLTDYGCELIEGSL